MESIMVIISIVIAFGITAALGFVIIPWLRKLKFGQTILEIGPSWHKSKQGTPNMGGIMFIIGITVSFIATSLIYHFTGGSLLSDYTNTLQKETKSDLVLLIAGLCLALGFGIVGFLDDFIKIKMKRNEGLSAKQKTAGQLLVTFGFITTLWLSHNTTWYLPFIGSVNFEKNVFSGVIFWLVSIFIVYGAVNSVNLTDGIDGLSGTLSILAVFTTFLMGFMCLSLPDRNSILLLVVFIPSVIAYLLYNFNPSKMLMGDAGSRGLGFFIAFFLIYCRVPLLYFIVGLPFLCDGGISIVKITVGRLTKKKIILFKNITTPLHDELRKNRKFSVKRVWFVLVLAAGIIDFLYVFTASLLRVLGVVG